MSEEILQPNKPFKYTSRNPRTSYRQLKRGEIFLLEIEVEEEIWNAVRTLPKNALIENISWFHDGDNAEPEPILGTLESPEKKGMYGSYWRFMHRPDQHGANFTTFPDLQQVLGVETKDVHAALRTRLDVSSLTFVSPRQFEKFVEDNGLSQGLITMSRQCEVKAAEAK